MISPMRLAQVLHNSGNPQRTIMDIAKQQAGNNPVINNALQMMEKGDNVGIENLARNLCKEKGINPDEMLSQVKNQFGIR